MRCVFSQENFTHLHKPHLRAFKRAQELGLNVTIHAGEVGHSSYIKRAVEEYGASRIGHGYHIAQNSQLMNDMRQKNIFFEVCPTSSVETGGWDYDNKKGKEWKNHPCISMIQNGMKVGFNSDDPAGEYRIN